MNKISYKFIIFIISIVLTQDYMRPPETPQILGVGGDGFVTVTWDRVAESSIDQKTGYADFEGYRLYRSTDGGITWGNIETDIIPKDGEIVGWLPLDQYDLNELQDIERCIYSNAYNDDCIDDPNTEVDESFMRGISVSGADPAAPWFYLGNNTSINNSYIDTDVINGVEYTYAITAYDMGVIVDSVAIIEEDGQIILDTIFNISNPGGFSCPSEWLDSDINPYGSCPSFESPKFSESFTDYNSNGTWDEGEPWSDENGDGQWNSIRENIINIVTVTPSKNASDISFPDPENTESFMIADSLNVGTGLATYRFVDESDLESALIKIAYPSEKKKNDKTWFSKYRKKS